MQQKGGGSYLIQIIAHFVDKVPSREQLGKVLHVWLLRRTGNEQQQVC